MRTILVFLFIALAASFSVTSEDIPQSISWPFVVCGNGTWTMKNLTLGHVVTRNVDDDVDAINVHLFRSV